MATIGMYGMHSPQSGGCARGCRAHRLVLLAPLLWPEVVNWAPRPNDAEAVSEYWHRELCREVSALFQPDRPGWTLRDKIALAGSARNTDEASLAACAAHTGIAAACLGAWQRAFQALSQCCETEGLNLGTLQERLAGLQAPEPAAGMPLPRLELSPAGA